MDDRIPLTCPRCKTAWEKSLQALERLDEMYRGLKGTPRPENPAVRIVNYRDQCPTCGIYVIATVQED